MTNWRMWCHLRPSEKSRTTFLASPCSREQTWLCVKMTSSSASRIKLGSCLMTVTVSILLINQNRFAMRGLTKKKHQAQACPGYSPACQFLFIFYLIYLVFFYCHVYLGSLFNEVKYKNNLNLTTFYRSGN